MAGFKVGIRIRPGIKNLSSEDLRCTLISSRELRLRLSVRCAYNLGESVMLDKVCRWKDSREEFGGWVEYLWAAIWNLDHAWIALSACSNRSLHREKGKMHTQNPQLGNTIRLDIRVYTNRSKLGKNKWFQQDCTLIRTMKREPPELPTVASSIRKDRSQARVLKGIFRNPLAVVNRDVYPRKPRGTVLFRTATGSSSVFAFSFEEDVL